MAFLSELVFRLWSFDVETSVKHVLKAGVSLCSDSFDICIKKLRILACFSQNILFLLTSHIFFKRMTKDLINFIEIQELSIVNPTSSVAFDNINKKSISEKIPRAEIELNLSSKEVKGSFFDINPAESERILLSKVDDHDSNNIILAQILISYGYIDKQGVSFIRLDRSFWVGPDLLPLIIHLIPCVLRVELQNILLWV